MNRTARDKTANRPKAVQKIELSGEHLNLRLVLSLAALCVAVLAIANVAVSLFSVKPGWRVIEPQSGDVVNCAGDFVFRYWLGEDESLSPAAENKKVTLLYREATENAYELFNAEETFEGVVNPAYLSAHPNETVTVDPALYEAFALMEKYGCRQLYLAPIYRTYNTLFFCGDESETVNYDPYRNPEVADDFRTTCGYVNDPAMIRLELLGNSQVRLAVSPEYADYVKENGFTAILDFYWLRNAFVIDYLASFMQEHGMAHGLLSSYDGFTRCLWDRESGYTANLTDCRAGELYLAGKLDLQGAVSMVLLRDHRLDGDHEYTYYPMSDGTWRTAHIDPADGLCRSAVSLLVCYGQEKSCAEMLLQLLPYYIADEWDADGAVSAIEAGTELLWCRDLTVWHTEPKLTLRELYETDALRYQEKVYP